MPFLICKRVKLLVPRPLGLPHSLRSLGQNLLKELPDEISHLVSLKKLQLTSNLFKMTPVQISGLTNLEWL